MIKEKTYIGNLNIGENIISVDTDVSFNLLVIKYIGKIKIKKLNNNLNVSKNRKTIVVQKGSSKNISDLFAYKGVTFFSKCYIIDQDRKVSYNLYINKSNLQLWNTLKKSESMGGNKGVVQVWEYLTRNWEDMSFDGKNDKKPYIHRITTYDEEKNTYTTIKEIRKR